MNTPTENLDIEIDNWILSNSLISLKKYLREQKITFEKLGYKTKKDFQNDIDNYYMETSGKNWSGNWD